MIYITGDTHGEFRRIIDFCDRIETTRDDVMIILGDAGINFSGYPRDGWKKQLLARLPLKIFCIHGNHEKRPETIKSYKTTSFHGGTAWYEDDYPNILFAKDGEIYDFDGNKCIAIGGAYSVDKWYRLQMGYPWFEDEQPSGEIKKYVESQLAKKDWKIDVVLSHTLPFEYMPIDLFISGIDQSTVDNSTEHWLSDIEIKLNYKWWYAGHYHTSRITDKVQIMFEDIEEFGIHGGLRQSDDTAII